MNWNHDNIAKYQLILLDLWGVIHDGQTLYPKVKETLQNLREQKKKIMFVSNAPRRAAQAQARLGQLGIDSSLYDGIMTSGEAGWLHLRDNLNIGSHYYYLGPSKDEDILMDLPYEPSDENRADFILCTGFEEDFQPEEDIVPTLEKLLVHDLKMLCMNPDIEVVRQDGTRQLCAGWVAQRYKEMGGKVQYFGKPYPDVYGLCLVKFLGVPIHKVLMVGDNLLTDIAGANVMEIDSVLIEGGILKETGKTTTEAITEAGVEPTYILPGFAALLC